MSRSIMNLTQAVNFFYCNFVFIAIRYFDLNALGQENQIELRFTINLVLFCIAGITFALRKIVHMGCDRFPLIIVNSKKDLDDGFI